MEGPRALPDSALTWQQPPARVLARKALALTTSRRSAMTLSTTSAPARQADPPRKPVMSLLELDRITKLERLGEDLVAERLEHHGYTNIEESKSSASQLSCDEKRYSIFHRREGVKRNAPG